MCFLSSATDQYPEWLHAGSTVLTILPRVFVCSSIALTTEDATRLEVTTAHSGVQRGPYGKVRLHV